MIVSRLRRTDAERVQGIKRELDVFHTDQPRALDALLPAIREALELPKIVAYDVRAGDAGFELGRLHHDRMHRDDHGFRDGLQHYVANSHRRIGYFNPLRPERRQRNRVITLRIAKIFEPGRSPVDLGLRPGDHADVERNLEIMQTMFTAFGIHQDHQIRALLCDKETMLCFFGGYQPEPFSHRQVAKFQALVGPLRRRLIREERLQNAPALCAALDVALEHVAGAALLVTVAGRVEHANSAGRRLCKGMRLPAELREELKAPKRFDVTPVAVPGAQRRLLIVERPGGAELPLRVARAVRRLGLTPREAEILELLASGESNRAISGQLLCSERTVEVHVTHILEKADVESRAALIAHVWSSGG